MSFETTAVVILFPLLLPIWQERPLQYSDLYPGPSLVVMPKEAVELQKEAFRFNDAEFRGRLAIPLRLAGSVEAGRVLFGQLSDEPVPAVRATILTQLQLMAATLNITPKAIAPYLEDPAPVVRQAGIRLYARLKDADVAKLIAVAEKDPDSGVRIAAMEMLAAYYPEPGHGLLRLHWQDPIPAVRALALKAGLSVKTATETAATFTAACADPEPIVREALAQALPQAPGDLALTLARTLAADSHVSVRISVAQAIPEMKNPELLPVLLKLADDRDPEVRRWTAAALVAYPAPEGVAKAVALFNDPMNLVRREAEETVVKLHPHCPAVPTLAAVFYHDNPWVRYHVCRSLGRLKAEAWREKIAAGLETETRAENLASVIFALWQLDAKFAGTRILTFAGHPHAMVREQVAIACGVLNPQGGHAVLKTAVFDPDRNVRLAALLAMGRLADGTFSDTLVEVLKCTLGEKNIGSEDRRYACWVAGRLRPISMALMERMVVQATTAVIPSSPIPAFEDDLVLVSVSMALVQCAREQADVKPLAEKVLAYHAEPAPAPKPVEKPVAPPPPAKGGPPMNIEEFFASGGSMTLFPSAARFEFTHQARAWLENREVTPQPRPTMEITFPYRRMTKLSD